MKLLPESLLSLLSLPGSGSVVVPDVLEPEPGSAPVLLPASSPKVGTSVPQATEVANAARPQASRTQEVDRGIEGRFTRAL